MFNGSFLPWIAGVVGVLCDLIHLSTWLAWLSRPKVCKFPWTTSSHRASEETRGQERLVPWEKRHPSCLRLCGCWESKWFKHAVCFGTFSPQDGFVNNVSIHPRFKLYHSWKFGSRTLLDWDNQLASLNAYGQSLQSRVYQNGFGFDNLMIAFKKSSGLLQVVGRCFF